MVKASICRKNTITQYPGGIFSLSNSAVVRLVDNQQSYFSRIVRMDYISTGCQGVGRNRFVFISEGLPVE